MIDCYKNCEDLRNGVCPPMKVLCPKKLAEHDKQIRADERNNVLDEVNVLIQTRLIDALSLANATKYGNLSTEQQSNSYATVMKYEIADCVYDLIDDLEELKENK